MEYVDSLVQCPQSLLQHQPVFAVILVGGVNGDAGSVLSLLHRDDNQVLDLILLPLLHLLLLFICKFGGSITLLLLPTEPGDELQQIRVPHEYLQDGVVILYINQLAQYNILHVLVLPDVLRDDHPPLLLADQDVVDLGRGVPDQFVETLFLLVYLQPHVLAVVHDNDDLLAQLGVLLVD